MEHIAIDLGGKESQMCVRAADGTILLEKRVPTASLGFHLRTRPAGSRVIVEASSEAFAVADLAQAAGHEIRVVPTKFVKMLGVGDHGIKNDVRDARNSSRVSVAMPNLPSVHVASQSAREARSFCTTRELLVDQRTQLCNRIRAYLRTTLGKQPRATSQTLGKKVRQQVGDDLPRHLEIAIEQLESLGEAIKELDAELKNLAEQNDCARQLMLVPGVGPVTAVRFWAAIDDVSRFPSADRVCSYLGLTPGENTTGFKTRRTGITKAGPAPVRRALVQAAWSFMRTRPQDAPTVWVLEIAKRRGKKIAVIALAAKLARIMYAMLRDGTVYEPRMVEP